jgi:hypothetical protein
MILRARKITMSEQVNFSSLVSREGSISKRLDSIDFSRTIFILVVEPIFLLRRFND